jgi:hypothetical protein
VTNPAVPWIAVSPLQKIKDAYANVLHLREDDRLIIDYVVSVYVAMLHPQLLESLWGYIIGPASSGKTEALRIFYDWCRCIGVDEPTASSFQSGYVTESGEDVSLLAKLDGMLLFIKDMSTLMQSKMQEAIKVLSVLRGAHDGDSSKASGTLGLKHYKARFGMLIATTDVVDFFMEQNQQLGERLVSFRLNRTHLDLDERQGMLSGARGLEHDKELKRTRIRIVAHEQFDVLGKYCLKCTSTPKMSQEIESRIQRAGDLLAIFRTCAVQGVGGQPEMGYRVVQQLFNLGHAHAVADGREEWNDTDVGLVMRVIYDTLPKVKSRIINEMYKRGVHRPAESIEQVARRAKTTPDKIGGIFLQYIHSHVIECVSDSHAMPLYRLSSEYYKGIDACKFFDGMP